jgi:hypothetical protein
MLTVLNSAKSYLPMSYGNGSQGVRKTFENCFQAIQLHLVEAT